MAEKEKLGDDIRALAEKCARAENKSLELAGQIENVVKTAMAGADEDRAVGGGR